MRFIKCPYRGERIPGLVSAKGNAAQVCNHPEVRGPCVIEMPNGVARLSQLQALVDSGTADPSPIAHCVLCRRWKEPAAIMAANLASVSPLDSKTFQPAESIMRTRVKRRPVVHVPVLAAPSPSDCVHLGKETRRVDCLTCVDKILKVFACEVHGECTVARPGEGVAAICKDCPDRQPLIQIQPLTQLQPEREST